MSTARELIEGIRKGQVPRQVRLFAAQGLLPVSRDDLLTIQILLTSDPDEELGRVAVKSLREEETETLVGWVSTAAPNPLELDLLIRVRSEEAIWAAVARHPGVSDDTLRIMAKNSSPLIQDIIVTNQVRLLGCLDLLDDLRHNPQVNQVVLRRVREFEEEFIAKAVAAEGELPNPEPGPSLSEALEALKAIGAHLPSEEQYPLPKPADAKAAEEAVKAGNNVFAKILLMNIHQKILCGLKGSREERGILIHSRNNLVVRAVLASPKLSDLEVERFAADRSVSEEAIRVIANHPRWTRRYPVMVALVSNPKTAAKTAMNMIPRLNNRDLLFLIRNRNVPAHVRRQAMRIKQTRR
jgi:hypothetical protein